MSVEVASLHAVGGLHVHRSESASALVEGLAQLLATPPADPFVREVVAVPARGVERWITQRLSAWLGAGGRRDGVCAQVDFPRPDDLLAAAVASVSAEAAGSVAAWQPDRAVWGLLAVLDEVLADDGDERFAGVRRHLGRDDAGARRYVLARRVADLFDRYAGARPSTVAGWAEGRDGDVPDDLSWQPELWRRLRRRLGLPAPSELLDGACAALRADPGAVNLPARLGVFGTTRLDAAQLQVLSALAARRDVHLWVHCASPVMWDGIIEPLGGSLRRADAPTWAGHPLLASLSRDVRELQLRLGGLGVDSDTHHPPAPAGSPTLLRRLQDDLRNDRVGAPPMVLAPGDRSVQVHACHGRARQVEVLREVLVGLMADDPTLEPRDVLVMCPDVEAYAPLVGAVFGAEDHPGGRLRVSLADRSPRRVNPLLDVAATLLGLATGRVTATQVLDFAGTEPVRARFGLDDEDLERLRAWTVAAGVRWGLSTEHRRGWQLEAVDQGTWRQGLDRLLAGVALDGDGGPIGGALPVPEVDSSAVDLAGRFAELVDRLEAAVTAMSRRHTVGGWLDLLERSVRELASVPLDRQWQTVALHEELEQVRAAAGEFGADLGLAEVSALLARRLEGRPTTAGFRTGGLTVCTLTPMRSVPHRVVCLLGMDDGAFPRQGSVDGDDLLLRAPLLGERDLRSEDRQLFLDALCAAGEHLVVTYGGADVRTGAELPPAVPVGELLDALDACAAPASGGRVRDAVVVHHPLQPFDGRNFTPGGLGRPGPFSFDEAWLSGAQAAAGLRREPPTLLGDPLPPTGETVVELSDLVRFWQHPVRGFLQQRLDVETSTWDEDPEDALPVEPDALRLWQVGDRMVRARLRGAALEEVTAAELVRGTVAPRPLGDGQVAAVATVVERLVAESAPHRSGPADSVPVDVTLPDGSRVIGVVPGVYGQALVTVTYARIKAAQRMRAWVQLLALASAYPRRPWQSVLVGRGERDRVSVTELGPLDPVAARRALTDLVHLRAAGMLTSLPLPLKTSEAYAAARRVGRDSRDALTEADRQWATDYNRTGEDDDACHVLVWGRSAPIDLLTSWAAPPGSVGPRTAGEPHDFGGLACRLWYPLLTAEQGGAP